MGSIKQTFKDEGDYITAPRAAKVPPAMKISQVNWDLTAVMKTKIKKSFPIINNIIRYPSTYYTYNQNIKFLPDTFSLLSLLPAT